MGIQVTGSTNLRQLGARVSSGALQKELVKGIQKSGPRIRADMQAATFTPIQRKAMDAVHFGNIANGMEIDGGRGSGLAAELFAGAEFGGRLSKKRRVRGYVFGKGPGTVYRRTTMMFLPHLGREGYFFWPTIRDWEPKLVEQASETSTKFLTGGL